MKDRFLLELPQMIQVNQGISCEFMGFFLTCPSYSAYAPTCFGDAYLHIIWSAPGRFTEVLCFV